MGVHHLATVVAGPPKPPPPGAVDPHLLGADELQCLPEPPFPHSLYRARASPSPKDEGWRPPRLFRLTYFGEAVDATVMVESELVAAGWTPPRIDACAWDPPLRWACSGLQAGSTPRWAVGRRHRHQGWNSTGSATGEGLRVLIHLGFENDFPFRRVSSVCRCCQELVWCERCRDRWASGKEVAFVVMMAVFSKGEKIYFF